MAISLNNPWGLLLIPLIIGIIIHFSRGLKKTVGRRYKAIVVTRILLSILLILSLIGVNIKTYVRDVATIFLVDLSESTEAYVTDFKDFIESSLEHATDKDKIGVVTFGLNSEVEYTLSNRLKSVNFQTNPGKGFTNIEMGLRMSQALLPDNTMKRIVLLTDGLENLGNSSNEGEMLKYNDIDLKVYRVEGIQGPEVQINNIEMPKTTYENQSFDIAINIYSNIKTQGTITLYSGRQLVGERQVSIEKGDNRFLFRDKATESGFKSYRAVINPKEDTLTRNNQYSTFMEVRGNPRVLVIEGESGEGRELNKLLQASNIETEYIKGREAPRNLSELAKYSSIILCDVSIDNLNNVFLSSLESYVKDYGGGLVVTGGENSYAMGGYYQTVLEEILPVEMEMKTKGEVPNLGLLLIIDKSGSMEATDFGLSRMELAKEAAIKAVDSLRPKDEVGVIAFDGSPQWVVNLSPADNKQEIVDSIGTIRAGGGTSILPALREGYLALKESDTKLKHIILLTDGIAERSGYDYLIEDMKKEGITISTVAVGGDSDVSLLEYIAQAGKGRYYFVDEYSSIPEIFTKETLLASKSYLNNRSFYPRVSHYHDIINPFLDGVPLLDGYIGTTAKSRAETILYSDEDDPILSTWQYGLGRTVAWTSDVSGKWSSNYLSTNEGVDFLLNIVEWTFPRVNNENMTIKSQNLGVTEEIIVMNSSEESNQHDTMVTIIPPSLESYEIKLNSTRPGEYKGIINVEEEGVYILRGSQYEGENIISTASHGIAVNYSKEYDITSSQNRLDSLIARADGEYISDPTEVFDKKTSRVLGSRDLTDILIILAMLLLVVDIGLRRLNLRFKRLEAISDRVQSKITSTVNLKDRCGFKKTIDSRKHHENKSLPNNHYINTETTKSSYDDSKLNNSSDKESKEKDKSQTHKKTDSNSLDTSRLIKAKDKGNR